MRPARLLTEGVGLACLILALAAGLAHAHKVNVFAYAEGDSVHTQAYFNDGRPAVDSAIEVYDGSGRLLLSGKTNEAGEFAFPAPKVAGDLKIVLVASMGHKNEFLLSASELPQPKQAKDAPPKAAGPKPSAQAVAPAPPQAEVAATLDDARLRAVVREEVDAALQARLAPVVRLLATQGRQEGVRMSDVVAGIGYIFGLAGVAAYFAGRRRSQAGP